MVHFPRTVMHNGLVWYRTLFDVQMVLDHTVINMASLFLGFQT